MFLQLNLFSHTPSLFRLFIRFLVAVFKFLEPKVFLFLTVSSRNLQKLALTILKSPHVNKTAQEQFYLRTLLKTFQIKTFFKYQLLLILKYTTSNLFSNAKIVLKSFFCKHTNLLSNIPPLEMFQTQFLLDKQLKPLKLKLKLIKTIGFFYLTKNPLTIV